MEIHISPSEIKEKEFPSGLGGYKKSEVTIFLDEVAAQSEAMIVEIKELKNHIARQDKELEKLDEQKDLLKRTLLLAEKLKDEVLINAKREAKNIIADAEITSKQKIKKAKDFLSILEHDYINLKEQKNQFVQNFKAKINVMLENLEDTDKTDKIPESENSFSDNEKSISTEDSHLGEKKNGIEETT